METKSWHLDKYSFFYEEKAQPSQHLPRKWESKKLSEVLTMSASMNESQCQETCISSQSLYETSNLESNTYEGDDFRSGSRDDYFNSLVDLIAYGSQEFDSYEDPSCLFSQEPRFSLLRLCTSGL